MNVILILILLSIVGLIASIWFIYFQFLVIKRNFIDFVTPPDEKTPSQLGAIVTSISKGLASEIILSFRNFFAGLQSGKVRSEQAALIESPSEQPNIAGGLVGLLGSSKRLQKNPILAAMAGLLMNQFVPHDNNHESVSEYNPNKFGG